MPEEDGRRATSRRSAPRPPRDFVAVMAQAARIYQPYDADFADTCLAAARRGYAFLPRTRGPAVPDTPRLQHRRLRPQKRRRRAAVGRRRAVGDDRRGGVPRPTSRRDIDGRHRVDADFDWDNVRNLGLFTYLLSKRDGTRSHAGRGADAPRARRSPTTWSRQRARRGCGARSRTTAGARTAPSRAPR